MVFTIYNICFPSIFHLFSIYFPHCSPSLSSYFPHLCHMCHFFGHVFPPIKISTLKISPSSSPGKTIYHIYIYIIYIYILYIYIYILYIYILYIYICHVFPHLPLETSMAAPHLHPSQATSAPWPLAPHGSAALPSRWSRRCGRRSDDGTGGGWLVGTSIPVGWLRNPIFM